MGDVCPVDALLGCIFMLESAYVLSFPSEQPEASLVETAVTVLKPLHEAEPGLPSRLVAFCRQNYSGPHTGPMRFAEPRFACSRHGLDQC